MNILYLCHRIPYPPTKGDKIRSFHQIRYLSERHTLALACLADEREDLAYVPELEKYCASVDVVYRDKAVAKSLAGLALLTQRPLSVASFYSRELQRRIEARLETGQYDIVVVFSAAMAPYAQHVSGLPKVMDFVDVDSEKWRLYAEHHPFPVSWIYRVEADRLARYEEEVARTFDHCLFVSEREADLFRRRVSDRPISVIQNGVDLEFFHPNGQGPTSPNPPVIVFTGAMDYYPNVDAVKYFCGEILPRVRAEVPEVLFLIVGRHPARPVRALGRDRRVIVTGEVSDVRPYLAAATVAVAPFRIARGLQNKILEAMAMGCPVVGTPAAFQGIPATGADGVRIADDPQGFARELLTLLHDSTTRRECALQARRYVERCHQWRERIQQMESLLAQTVQAPGRGAERVGGDGGRQGRLPAAQRGRPRRKVCTIFGTRPEVIKLAPVIQQLEARGEIFQTLNVTSAQHTDLLYPFVRLFGIRVDYDLRVMEPDQTPNQVCSRVLSALDPLLTRETPDLILVQGDTTTAMAGALAGFHRRIPVGHVEAGLRSGNPVSPYPEEMNRRLITRLATYHFAATARNRETLLSEGVAEETIFVTGNPVVDSLKAMLEHATVTPAVDTVLRATAGRKRIVLTTHRRESFGEVMARNLTVLRRFVERHGEVALIFPVHRNPAVLSPATALLSGHPRIFLIPPLEYGDFIVLLSHAWLIVSDSGGVQEEAPTLGKPVLILRENTERPEAVESGVARLVGGRPERLAVILEEVYQDGSWADEVGKVENPFGRGDSGKQIVRIIGELLGVAAADPCRV